jgi:tripartite-type tricarboxylate transporter receptor subunit TctC
MTHAIRQAKSALAALIAAALLVPGTSFAQNFPSKPIRLVLPYAAVGLPDVLARLVATRMSKSIGQQVIVDNKPGAGGILASELVAKAAPDGYTLMLLGNSEYAITPVLHARLPYDPERDFAPVTDALRGTFFLVANSSLGVNTVRELVALAKARPGVINFGSPGIGSTHHLAMAQLAVMSGMELTHVPYVGIAQATPALLSGDVSLMIVTLPSVLTSAKAGKLRLLAAASAQRSSLMPDLPTVTESGYPGLDVQVGLGFVVPAATPQAVVERLNAELVSALRSPEVETRMVGFGVEVVASTPARFGERIRKDQEYYRRLVREIRLKID